MNARNAFMNGTTLQEFFPLVAKLAQQLRLPVVFACLDTTGSTGDGEEGLVEMATITVASSGSVNAHNSLIDPELTIQPGAFKVHGLRPGDLAGAPRFPVVYEALSKAFSTSLIIGLSASLTEVPIVYRNMVRYGLPIMSARHQLDLQDIWASEGNQQAGLEEILGTYKVSASNLHRSTGRALACARLLEVMLWKHGSDAVIREIKHTQLSYLTPDMILSPSTSTTIANARPIKTETAQKGKAQGERRRQEASTWIKQLKEVVADLIEQHRVIRPIHFAQIAERMQWTESKVSIEIGRLLTQGRLQKEPFIVPDDQALLAVHLPPILAEMPEVKLKAVRQRVREITAKELEYIQIRLALKKLGIWIDK